MMFLCFFGGNCPPKWPILAHIGGKLPPKKYQNNNILLFASRKYHYFIFRQAITNIQQ